MADDAYITFRHVVQFLAGNGLTYNTIERVEGFTHPLWALLLCFFGWLGAPLSGTAVTLDLLCAAALLIGIAASERDRGPLAMALVVSCSGFIDFATSGLETPMTMGLVYLAYRTRRVLDAPARVGLALGLAYLCHPDVAVLALGPFVLALAEARERGLRESRAAVDALLRESRLGSPSLASLSILVLRRHPAQHLLREERRKLLESRGRLHLRFRAVCAPLRGGVAAGRGTRLVRSSAPQRTGAVAARRLASWPSRCTFSPSPGWAATSWASVSFFPTLPWLRRSRAGALGGLSFRSRSLAQAGLSRGRPVGPLRPTGAASRTGPAL